MNSEIYTAIYNVLTGAGLTVYDHIPQIGAGQKSEDIYPYNRLSTVSVTPWDDDFETGFSASFAVHFFSRYKGSKEVEENQKIVYDNLHRVKLSDTASFQLLSIVFESSQILDDPDGMTKHGVQNFNIIYEVN